MPPPLQLETPSARASAVERILDGIGALIAKKA
jgi:hypothetical protein